MTTAARAIVSRDTLEAGGWRMEEVTVRPPGPGELLVEMAASGICHTDVLCGSVPAGAAPTAFYPRILGHEGSGYVAAVGPGVTVAQPGDPVLLSFDFCRTCAVCRSGIPGHCTRFTELNFAGPYPTFGDQGTDEPTISGVFFGQSSFASRSIVHEASVVNATDLVKDKTELQLFAPLGCGIQTGCGTVVNAAQASRDDVVVIMGLGGVGLSAVMGTQIQGCGRVIGVDKQASRLKLAQELGCTDTVDASTLGDKSLSEAIRELTSDGPTITIDTTGVPALIQAGMDFTRNKGKVVQVGSAPFDFNLEVNMFSFMLSGKQLIGAIEGHANPPDFVPKMVQWYREGRFPIDKLVKFMKADDFGQGLQEMHDGSTVKPILLWS